MRKRIDTPDGDVTGPTLPPPPPLAPPYPGSAMAALRGARLEHVRVGRDPLPDLGAVDGLVTFGGAESVTEIERYPALQEEAELLRAAVARELPVLGVC